MSPQIFYFLASLPRITRTRAPGSLTCLQVEEEESIRSAEIDRKREDRQARMDRLEEMRKKYGYK